MTPAGLPWLYVTAMNALPTADGGAVIYGATDSYAPGLYKVDGDGNVLWENSAFIGTYYMYGGQAVQLTDGRIITGGLTDFYHNFYEFDASGNNLSNFTIAPDTTGGWAWSYWEYKETGMVATDDGGFAYATGSGNKSLYINSTATLIWSGQVYTISFYPGNMDTAIA